MELATRTMIIFLCIAAIALPVGAKDATMKYKNVTTPDLLKRVEELHGELIVSKKKSDRGKSMEAIGALFPIYEELCKRDAASRADIVRLVRTMKGKSEQLAREAVEKFKKLEWSKVGLVIHQVNSSDPLRVVAFRDFDTLKPNCTIEGSLWRVELSVDLQAKTFDAKLVTAAEYYKNEGTKIAQEMAQRDWSVRRRALARAPLMGMDPPTRKLYERQNGTEPHRLTNLQIRYLRECAKDMPDSQKERVDESLFLSEWGKDMDRSRMRSLLGLTAKGGPAVLKSLRSEELDELMKYRLLYFLVVLRDKDWFRGLASAGAMKKEEIDRLMSDRDPKVRQLFAVVVVERREQEDFDKKTLFEHIASAMETGETTVLRYKALFAMERLLGLRLDFDPFADKKTRGEYLRWLREEKVPKSLKGKARDVQRTQAPGSRPPD